MNNIIFIMIVLLQIAGFIFCLITPTLDWIMKIVLIIIAIWIVRLFNKKEAKQRRMELYGSDKLLDIIFFKKKEK